jgi:hypothetical protein
MIKLIQISHLIFFIKIELLSPIRTPSSSSLFIIFFFFLFTSFFFLFFVLPSSCSTEGSERKGDAERLRGRERLEKWRERCRERDRERPRDREREPNPGARTGGPVSPGSSDPP